MIKRSILVLLVVALLMSFAPGIVSAEEEASLTENQAEMMEEVTAADAELENEATNNSDALMAGEESAFAGGTGTAEDPYLIETKYHLDNVRNHLSAHYKMIADITFTSADFAEGGDFYNDGAGWQPIGSSSGNQFTGTFDGNYHIIEGLQIIATTSTNHLGLFGYVGSSTFKNLGMVGGSIFKDTASTGTYIGGIVGRAGSGATVSFDNCYFDGIISCTQSLEPCVGGIIGLADTESLYMTDCYSAGNISVESRPEASESHAYIGGIAGRSRTNIVLSNCCNVADIYAGLYANNEGFLSAYTYIGGLVGTGDFDSISLTQCYNTGDIYAKTTSFRTGLAFVYFDDISPSAYAGGIIGYGSISEYADVSACYNTGNIIAEVICTNSEYEGNTFAQSGGIFGVLSGGKSVPVHIQKCYNTGVIKADAIHFNGGTFNTFEAYAGGIVGGINVQSTIKDCYNMGNVISRSQSGYDTAAQQTYAYSGGIIGTGTYSSVSTCYSTGELSAYAKQYVSSENAVAQVGGICGTSLSFSSSVTVENCYYSLDDAQMQQQETFAGFDFDNVWTMRGCKYPQLRAFVKVDNVEFAPITIFENSLGDWNGDNFQYWWWENLSYTITYVDGSTYEGWGTYFEYQGEGCELVFSDTQEEAPWKAGNTYEVTANFLGYEVTVPVTVMESPVASVEFEPVTMFANCGGQWVEDFYEYYWWDSLIYTITFQDGSTYTGSGYWLEYEGQEYPVVQYDGQYETNWQAGNTYEAIAAFLGYEVTVPVTILECPVESVAVEPIYLIENTYCYGDSYCHWWDLLSYTITYKDGITRTGYSGEFEYQGNPYYVWGNDSQEETPWEAGNTYEVTANFLGYEVTVPVTVMESPVASVEFEPVTMFANCGGQWVEDFYEYYWWDSLIYTITFRDGSTYTGSGYWVEYEGQSYPAFQYDGQYETHWQAGNTYEAIATFLGYEVTVPVTILECPVVSVEARPVTLFENASYHFNGTYDQYYWWEELGYTITYADDTSYTGCGGYFEYQGNEYSITYMDTQEETSWEVGNTYEVTAWYLGYEVTVPVTIAPCPVASVEVEPITMVAYTGGNWYDENYWYYWWENISYTVTFTDGTTFSGVGEGVDYEDWVYMISYWDPQYDCAWEVGNTYEARLNFLGYDTMVPVSIVESAYINSSSLTLGSALKLNISAELNGLTAEGHSLRVTVGEEVRQFSDFTTDAEQIVFTVPLPAHQLHQDVRLELICKDQVVDVKTWTLGYYYYSLRWEYADDAALMALLDSLSDYATYAQYFADPQGTAVPNVAALTGVQQETLKPYKSTISTSNPGLGTVVSLYLDDACDLRVKFNADAWDEGYKLLVNGEAVTVEMANGKVMCVIPQLLPQDWSKVFNIRVVDAQEATAFEVNYSVLSYAYICLGKAQELQTGLNDLLKAMYLYNQAAANYISA